MSVKIELAAGEGHQGDALDQPGQVDNPRFSALDAMSWVRRPASRAICQWARPCSHRTTAAMVGMAVAPIGPSKISRTLPSSRPDCSPVTLTRTQSQVSVPS